jgi:DNA-binding transcriptional MerR regulator
MPDLERQWNIGEAAARAGCTPEAIRYHERDGVLPAPARAGAGRYRRYGEADVERLRFVRRARDLGFTLDAVRGLLDFAEGDPTRSCSQVDAMARQNLAQVEDKLARLTALRTELSRMIVACRQRAEVADCRILGALAGR